MNEGKIKLKNGFGSKTKKYNLRGMFKKKLTGVMKQVFLKIV